MTEELTPLAHLTPESFRRGNVAADADLDLAAQIFVLDAQEQVPGVRRLRDWTMTALAPRPGETAVDVGCGTGGEVCRMAELVGPEGRAIGVEPHAGLRTEAERRAAGTAARFVDGELGALPFDDGSVDLLRCERVFQHLADPQAAAAEIARVLAPHGRVAITDSDWGTIVQRPGDPDVVRRVAEASWRRQPNPFSGRHLRTQLQRAGLVVDPVIGADALVMPDTMLADPQLLRLNTRYAVADGAVTAEEADALLAEMVEAAEKGEAFGAVTMFSVVARRFG